MKLVTHPCAGSTPVFRKNARKRCALFAILVCLYGIPSWQPAAAQVSDSQPDSIHGSVINSITHEPVGHALVYSPDSRFATMTDSDGHFEFTFPKTPAETAPGGSVQPGVMPAGMDRPSMLVARKPGFLDNRGEQLAQLSSSSEVILTLVPEALMVGHVSVSRGEPGERVQVELYRRQVQEGGPHWIHAGSVTARSNGEFRFAELPAGSYKLLTRELLDRDPLTFDPRGQLFGYPPVYYPAATDFAAAGIIQLAAGKTFQPDLSLVRQPYYRVRVPVASVPPGVGMMVVVSVQGHRGPGFALGYNHQDQAIEGMLPSGNYSLEASTYGQVAASGVLNITVQGGPLEGPRMVLVQNAQIRVNVREEFTSAQENPETVGGTNSNRGGSLLRVRNLNLRLQPADDFGEERGALLAESPKDHSLVLTNVQPGHYWVRFDSSRGYVASASCGTVDLLHHPLPVPLGGSTPPIEVTMRDDNAEISGTVEEMASLKRNENSGSFGDGSTVVSGYAPYSSGAHIYFVPLDGAGQFREAWVAADGNFTSPPLAPGSYRVLAFDRTIDELEYHNSEGMRAYDAKGVLVRVVAGQKERVQVHLIKTGDS